MKIDNMFIIKDNLHCIDYCVNALVNGSPIQTETWYRAQISRCREQLKSIGYSITINSKLREVNEEK